jgi:hypothetical protein
VFFADVPNFRAYFHGSQKVFVNALLLSSLVDFEPSVVSAATARCKAPATADAEAY